MTARQAGPPETRDLPGEALADQIQALLREHDAAGVVCVMTRARVHYRSALDTSWTGMTQDDTTGAIHVRLRTGGPVAATLAVLSEAATWCVQSGAILGALVRRIEQGTGAKLAPEVGEWLPPRRRN